MIAREHDHADGTCLDLAERISEFIDGELPSELRVQVEAHLAACATCVRFVESLRRTRDMARLFPPPGLPAERLRELAREARRRLGEEPGRE